jgi:hypothetical protein
VGHNKLVDTQQAAFEARPTSSQYLIVYDESVCTFESVLWWQTLSGSMEMPPSCNVIGEITKQGSLFLGEFIIL